MGINSLIIENGIARGANLPKTCLIFSEQEVPNIPFSFGLNNLDAFKARLSLFSDLSSLNVTLTENSKGEASLVEFSSGRSKSQFRPGSSTLLTQAKKVPKQASIESISELRITQEELRTIFDAVRVMKGDRISFSAIKGSVTFKVSDATNDSYTLQLKNNYVGEDFTVFFGISSLLAGLKNATPNEESDIDITICTNNIFKILIGKHYVYFTPNGESE